MELIRKYFPDLTDRQYRQFETLLVLVPELNNKINVISRKDVAFLEERHVLHSLSIALLHPFSREEVIIDAGTGGGFPGIPLAIMFPESSFILVDSIGKKIRVVEELVRELDLQNITARHTRVEQVPERADYVVSRAVTALPKLHQWTKHLFKASPAGGKGGIIALKGGDLESELSPFGKRLSMTPVSSLFEEAFFSSKMIVFLNI